MRGRVIPVQYCVVGIRCVSYTKATHRDQQSGTVILIYKV